MSVPVLSWSLSAPAFVRQVARPIASLRRPSCKLARRSQLPALGGTPFTALQLPPAQTKAPTSRQLLPPSQVCFQLTAPLRAGPVPANLRVPLAFKLRGHERPTLRANPSPEVTDPFCRLPLPTFFYSTRGCSPWRPDAVMSTIGDDATRSPGFSRSVGYVPDASDIEALFQRSHPFSG